MERTPRREWAFRSPVVLGVVALALAVLIVPVLRSDDYLFINVGGLNIDIRYVMYGTAIVNYAPRLVAASCSVILACGGLRWTTDWHRAAGWFLSVWWVGLGIAAYFLWYF